MLEIFIHVLVDIKNPSFIVMFRTFLAIEIAFFSFLAQSLSKDLEELEEKLRKNEEERDSLNLELDRAKTDQDELKGKLSDAEERIQELEAELDEARQELIDARNMPQGETLEVMGQLS